METQAYFENIQAQIQERLATAEKEIDLAVAWFTDRVLFKALCKKAVSGVSVRLLMFDDDINAQNLPFDELTQAGGKVFRLSEKLMHNKFCVIDRSVVMTGSYNWTNKANTDNYENITVTTGDPIFAMQFVSEFNRIVEKHFAEKQTSAIDLHQIIKRLELIRQFIELGDTDELQGQYRKLKTLTLPETVREILNLLDAKRFSDAVTLLKDFTAKHNQLNVFTDTNLLALKLELHALELEIGSLQNEKSDIEKNIRDFSVQYHRALGDVLLQILILRQKLAEHAATQKPDDTKAQAEQKEAEEDYETYNTTYEAAQQMKQNVLSDVDKTVLKNKFREASKLCHPDVVSEDFKEKAAGVFSDLKKAYDENDLETVSNILEYLKNGKPYQAGHETAREKAQLIALVNRLRQQRDALLAQLHELKNAETYKTISDLNDQENYFNTQRNALETVLHNLKEKCTTINNQ